MNKPVKLTGKVTEMKFSNPHSWIYLDVETNGKVVNWALETGAANALIRRGWKKTDLPAGTVLVRRRLAGAQRHGDGERVERDIHRWEAAVCRARPTSRPRRNRNSRG